jgi:hypothetical protein
MSALPDSSALLLYSKNLYFYAFGSDVLKDTCTWYMHKNLNFPAALSTCASTKQNKICVFQHIVTFAITERQH